VFALTLIDYFRRRDAARLEITALFATLAAIVIVQALGKTIVSVPHAVSTFTTLLFLAQPYFLFRLIGHFRRLTRIQHAVALALVVGSGVAFLLSPPVLSPGTLLAIVVAFALLEG